MATKSFYEDMIIDTPEAAARLTELFEENRVYVPLGIEYNENDPEGIRLFIERNNPEQ